MHKCDDGTRRWKADATAAESVGGGIGRYAVRFAEGLPEMEEAAIIFLVGRVTSANQQKMPATAPIG